ncbi:hypothetical protein KQI69_02560 [Eubacterium sp. MSJ-13]|nr:hypothetical protein [Eubacterium sp. MSJ-13]MBU5478077.1 hypothetical protein [Eubacterium sp. MSJ-13]
MENSVSELLFLELEIITGYPGIVLVAGLYVPKLISVLLVKVERDIPV